MTEEEIKAALYDLQNLMIDKGLKSPIGHASIHMLSKPSIFIYDENDLCNGHHYGENLEGCFASAKTKIEALPSLERLAMDQFLKLAAAAADFGAANNIDIKFLNPITESMKALSKNILEAPK